MSFTSKGRVSRAFSARVPHVTVGTTFLVIKTLMEKALVSLVKP